MAGGSLRDYLKQEHSVLSAHQKLDILLEVAHGIEYLHKQDVAHGNLTGDNVFIDGSGRLPGDARYTALESIFTGGGTRAPKPTKEGDVYSYGCVAILVCYTAHLLLHFTPLFPRYCRERCRTGGFGKRTKYLQKKKRVHHLFIVLLRLMKRT
ncbi:kinase-like domain-containing protein [Suillus discolor]|uniref:Kinase-like domain-containing protein n=1 Tax=Suillus discolor TaxID=1912936 RepID=A0A9P7F7Q6_9AGAM|nr:kinase-like domain-containing protein [Suillus discolor]KAG2108611.1 kinase-like domain-containing protein [Suillus discolor]